MIYAEGVDGSQPPTLSDSVPVQIYLEAELDPPFPD